MELITVIGLCSSYRVIYTSHYLHVCVLSIGVIWPSSEFTNFLAVTGKGKVHVLK